MTADELVVQYEPLVRRMTSRYRFRSDIDDLRQVAYLGLLRAHETFDPDAGCSFVGWAALAIHHSLCRELRRARLRGFTPLRAEVPEPLSLEAPSGDDDGGCLLDLLAGDSNVENEAHVARVRALVVAELAQLSPRHRAIIEGRLAGHGLDALGDAAGISHQGVHSVVSRFAQRLAARAA